MRQRWVWLRLVVLWAVCVWWLGRAPLEREERGWAEPVVPSVLEALLVAGHAWVVLVVGASLVAPRRTRRAVLGWRLGGGSSGERCGRLLARLALALMVGLLAPFVWVHAALVGVGAGQVGSTVVAMLTLAVVLAGRRALGWGLALWLACVAGAMAEEVDLAIRALLGGAALTALGARRCAPSADPRARPLRALVFVGLLACVGAPAHPLSAWSSVEGMWVASWGPAVYELRAGRSWRYVPPEAWGDPVELGGRYQGPQWRLAGYGPIRPDWGWTMRRTLQLWPFQVGWRVGEAGTLRRGRLSAAEGRELEAATRAGYAALRRRRLALVPERGGAVIVVQAPRRETLSLQDGTTVEVWRLALSERELMVLVADSAQNAGLRVLVGCEGWEAFAELAEQRLGIPRGRWSALVDEPRDYWVLAPR